ncbi:hypothetical protein SNEBB_008974 [Seison nebaliae]|nr:hypothetical protein SNEBB_008974 [Seison nebaliae]
MSQIHSFIIILIYQFTLHLHNCENKVEKLRNQFEKNKQDILMVNNRKPNDFPRRHVPTPPLKKTSSSLVKNRIETPLAAINQPRSLPTTERKIRKSKIDISDPMPGTWSPRKVHISKEDISEPMPSGWADGPPNPYSGDLDSSNVDWLKLQPVDVSQYESLMKPTKPSPPLVPKRPSNMIKCKTPEMENTINEAIRGSVESTIKPAIPIRDFVKFKETFEQPNNECNYRNDPFPNNKLEYSKNGDDWLESIRVKHVEREKIMKKNKDSLVKMKLENLGNSWVHNWDGYFRASNNHVNTKIYFILVGDHIARDLSLKGHKEGYEIGRKLKRMVRQINYIFTGSSKHFSQMAGAIALGLADRVDYNDEAGRKYIQYKAERAEIDHLFLNSNPKFSVYLETKRLYNESPNEQMINSKSINSYEEFFQRYFLRPDNPQTYLIISDLKTIRYLILRSLQLHMHSYHSYEQLRLAEGSISSIEIMGNGKIRLDSLNL